MFAHRDRDKKRIKELEEKVSDLQLIVQGKTYSPENQLQWKARCNCGFYVSSKSTDNIFFVNIAAHLAEQRGKDHRIVLMEYSANTAPNF